MVPTNSIATFIAQNDVELRQMTAHLCDTLNYPGDSGDIVQDLYLKMLTNPIVQNYEQERTIVKEVPAENGETRKEEKKVTVKMSTYLFPIIKNHILTKLKSRDFRCVKYQLPDCDPLHEELSEIDMVLHHAQVDRNYQTLLLNNASTEGSDGLGADLRDFENHFDHSVRNKWFSLTKRKDKSIKTSGCTLVDIFRYLYQGYSNNEIANKYGVTNMSITNMKHVLKKEMTRFGLGSKNKKEPVQSTVPLKARILKAIKDHEAGRSWIPLAKLLVEAKGKKMDLSFTGLGNNANRMITAYNFLKEWRPKALEAPEKILCHYRAVSPLPMLHERLQKKDKVNAILTEILKGDVPAYVVERYATTLVDPTKKKNKSYVIKKHLKKFKV